MDQPANRLRILRTNEVAEMLGISRVTLWRWARRGLLPPKRIIGPNTVGWVEEEILSWLKSRPLGSPQPESVPQASASGSEPARDSAP